MVIVPNVESQKLSSNEPSFNLEAGISSTSLNSQFTNFVSQDCIENFNNNNQNNYQILNPSEYDSQGNLTYQNNINTNNNQNF